MAFVLKKTTTYFWPVKFKYPVSGGTFEEQTIELEFKRLKHSELKKMIEGKTSDHDFAVQVICGWKDVKEMNQSEVPFSSSALENLLEESGFAAAVVETYLKSVSGVVEKN